MVLSSLHTRDAMGAPFRLLDMGVPPFMVSSSLQAVISQRLIRQNCETCSEPHKPTPQESAWISSLSGKSPKGVTPMRGRGCSSCNGTGYAGRIGVYEMLEMDGPMAHATAHEDTTTFLRLAREQLSGQTMAHHALELVRSGRTSVAEAMRLAADID